MIAFTVFQYHFPYDYMNLDFHWILLLRSATQKCFVKCIDTVEDEFTIKQRDCVERCAKGFRVGNERLVQALQNKSATRGKSKLGFWT